MGWRNPSDGSATLLPAESQALSRGLGLCHHEGDPLRFPFLLSHVTVFALKTIRTSGKNCKLQNLRLPAPHTVTLPEIWAFSHQSYQPSGRNPHKSLATEWPPSSITDRRAL